MLFSISAGPGAAIRCRNSLPGSAEDIQGRILRQSRLQDVRRISGIGLP